MTSRTISWILATVLLMNMALATLWLRKLHALSFSSPKITLAIKTKEKGVSVNIEASTLLGSDAQTANRPGGAMVIPLYRTADPKISVQVGLSNIPDQILGSCLVGVYNRNSAGLWERFQKVPAAREIEITLRSADSIVWLAVPPADLPLLERHPERKWQNYLRFPHHQAVVAISITGGAPLQKVSVVTPPNHEQQVHDDRDSVSPNQDLTVRNLRSKVDGKDSEGFETAKSLKNAGPKEGAVEVPPRFVVAKETPRMIGELPELDIRFDTDSFENLSPSDWDALVSRYDMPLILMPYPNQLNAFGAPFLVLMPGGNALDKTPVVGVHERFGRYPLPIDMLPRAVVQSVAGRVGPAIWAGAERKFYLLSLALVEIYRESSRAAPRGLPFRSILRVDAADKTRFKVESIP